MQKWSTHLGLVFLGWSHFAADQLISLSAFFYNKSLVCYIIPSNSGFRVFLLYKSLCCNVQDKIDEVDVDQASLESSRTKRLSLILLLIINEFKRIY